MNQQTQPWWRRNLGVLSLLPILCVVALFLGSVGLAMCSGPGSTPSHPPGASSAPTGVIGMTSPTSGITSATSAPAINNVNLVDRHTWRFTNNEGYSFDMTVSLSQPVMFTQVRGKSHPDNPALIVGKQCGDGPNFQNAAVIAGVMSPRRPQQGSTPRSR
jgi:hypothetical protein